MERFLVAWWNLMRRGSCCQSKISGWLFLGFHPLPEGAFFLSLVRLKGMASENGGWNKEYFKGSGKDDMGQCDDDS